MSGRVRSAGALRESKTWTVVLHPAGSFARATQPQSLLHAWRHWVHVQSWIQGPVSGRNTSISMRGEHSRQ